METVTRAAQPVDLKQAAELIRNQPLFEPYSMTPAGLHKSLLAALERGEQIHVALHGNSIAGLVWFQLRGAFARSGYLRLLVTASEAQGQGVGAQLLALAERLVFAQADDMFLLVNSSNDAARRFYGRHGYVQVGTIPGFVAPGLDEVIMRRTNQDGQHDNQ